MTDTSTSFEYLSIILYWYLIFFSLVFICIFILENDKMRTFLELNIKNTYKMNNCYEYN